MILLHIVINKEDTGKKMGVREHMTSRKPLHYETVYGDTHYRRFVESEKCLENKLVLVL